MHVIPILFCLKLGDYLLAQFFYCNLKNFWLVPFLRVKVSVYSQFYRFQFLLELCNWHYLQQFAGDNICFNYANFEGLLQLCRWYFLLQLCWWIFLLLSCMWLFLLQLFSVGDNFVVFMQMRITIAIIKVVLSAVYNCFYCKM